jgi:tRNA G10  N-methylase Trm11
MTALAEQGEQFDSIITDPPYGLEFMGREWDG